MAQVLMPQRRESTLDTVLKGLGIASNIYNIKANAANLEKFEQEQQAAKDEKERLAKGVLTPRELLTASEKFTFSRTPTEGAIQVADDKGSPLYATVRREVKDPGVIQVNTVDEKGIPVIRTVQNVPGQVFRAPPKAAKEKSPVQVKRYVDGKEVVEFVNPQLGMRVPTGQDQKDIEQRKVNGVGIARTLEDAKIIKSAKEKKFQFDRDLSEMIALREKHKGGAILNREDVNRGKQLSKKLLLAYKDLSKLGVLSQADENIINTIIPEDPLAYDFVVGQDPILSNLKKFRQDINAEYENKVSNRLEKQFSIFPMTVINGKTGEQATVENDQELKEAEQSGFTRTTTMMGGN